jgi:GGDEF domain-containing protein
VGLFRDRRVDPGKRKLDPGFRDSGPHPDPTLLRDPETGLYSLPLLHEFLQYEIDGGTQTEAHERFVSPVCLAAIGIDTLPSLPDDDARARLVGVVRDALRGMTRRSDRLAASGNDVMALLRRTLAARARDFYAPHVRECVQSAAGGAGMPTSVSIGIASLTEHLVRGPDDMLKKAMVALEAARQQGPGSIVVYDFRTMAY